MPQPEKQQQAVPENHEAREATPFSPELRSLGRIVGEPPKPLPESPSTEELTQLESENVSDHAFSTFNEQYRNNAVLYLRGSLDRTAALRDEKRKDSVNVPEFVVVNQVSAYHEYFANAVNHTVSLMQRYEQLRAQTPIVTPEIEKGEGVARLYIASLDRSIRERVAFANVLLIDGHLAQHFGNEAELLKQRDVIIASINTPETRDSHAALLNGSLQDKWKRGNDLNQRIIDVLAGRGKTEGVPEGFLPQKLYLDLLTHRYKKFLELQESVARDPVLTKAKERHRALKERNDRAKRGQGEALNKEEGEEYDHLQRVLKNHEGELERLGGQRRATTEELIDFSDDLGHFQMDMAEVAHIQRQFGQHFDLNGANPVLPDQTPEHVRKAIGKNMQERADFHIDRTQRFLGRVEEDVLHEGIKEKIEDAWNKNGREGVREVSNALARFFTIPVPESLGLKEEAQKALTGPLNEAMGWPAEKRDLPWEALTPEEQKTVQERSRSVLDAIREFDRSKIERYRETADAIRALPPASDFVGQEITEPLPSVRVSPQNLQQMIAEHGGPTVYALLFRQLEGDWGTSDPPTGFIGEYGTFFRKIEKVIDTHVDVGTALFQQQHAYEGLRDYLFYAMLAAFGLGAILASLGTYATMRFSGKIVRGTARMGGNAARRTWRGLRSTMTGEVPESTAPVAEGAARGASGVVERTAEQLTRMRYIEQERAIARYIQESKIGQRVSQLRTFRFLSTIPESRAVAAGGKTLRVGGMIAVPAITAYELYENEGRVQGAKESKNVELTDVYRGNRSTIALEGAGVGATLLLPSFLGPLALAGSVVYAGKHAMNRSEVRADWAKTSGDWQRELGPIGSRQKLRDTTFANAVEAGGGGVLRTRLGSWLDTKEQQSEAIQSIDQAQIGARREIYHAYFEDTTLVPQNASPAERKQAVDDRMRCIHALTDGRYDNVTDAQLQMADAFAVLKTRARNQERMGFAPLLSYVDAQKHEQYINLKELENPTASNISKVVVPFLNNIRPLEDLLAFEALGDISRRTGNLKDKAVHHSRVRQAVLQRLSHRLFNAERSILVTDWSGVDLPLGITKGNTQSQNIVRAALRKRIEQQIQPLTEQLMAGDLTPDTYKAAVRKIENLFQDFQNAGDTDARLAGATKELTKDEQEKAAVAKMSVLMELLQ
ncbi:hypothetical protein A3C37_02765 [Candidatus Peribacteria bacterium RIFCSPHIGHO2_02_FULL_53_20]|nr:MAG: hypothetical protein A3C37_02765 [Candidatus Peribacteria bacterium RIFCSPHIGHO2_02_FULL_53_20]